MTASRIKGITIEIGGYGSGKGQTLTYRSEDSHTWYRRRRDRHS